MRKIEVQITGDSGSLKRALGDATDHTGRFGSALHHLGRMAEAGFAAVGVASVVGIGLSVKAALDAEESQARLGQAFKNVGLSAEAMAPKIDKAEAAGRRLGFTDDDVRQSMGSLVTATGNAGKAINDLGVAQDLARFKGVDLGDATKMMTMAMTGSQRAAKQLGITVIPLTTHMNALKDAHVDLTTESGRAAAAHAKLLDKMATGQAVIDALNEKVHGQGKAFADTAMGGMEQFHAQVQHIEEALGAHLLPAVAGVATGLSDFIDKIGQADGASAKIGVVFDAIKSVVSEVGTALKDEFNAIDWAAVGDTLKGGLSSALSFLAGVDWGGYVKTGAEALWSALQAAFGAIDWGALGQAVGHALTTALNKISEYVKSVNWNNVGQQLVHGIGVAIEALARFLAGVDWGAVLVAIGRGIIAVLLALGGVLVGIAAALGKAILTGIGNGLEGIANWVEGKFSQLWGWLKGTAPGLALSAAKSVGDKIVDGVVKALKDLVPDTLAKFSALGSAIKGWAGSAYAYAFAIGFAIIEGILAGLGGLAVRVGEKIASEVKSGINWARHHLGSTAEEYAAAELGLPLVEGIALGIREGEDKHHLISNALGETVDKASKSIGPVVHSVGGDVGDSFMGGIVANITAALPLVHSVGGDTAKTFIEGMGERIVDAYNAGALIGKAWVSGIRDAALGALRDTISALVDEFFAATMNAIAANTATVAGNLGGSLGTAPRLPGLQSGGYVSRTGLAVVHAGETYSGVGGRSGGGGDVHFHFPNYVGDKRDLEQTMRSALLKIQQRQGTTFIR